MSFTLCMGPTRAIGKNVMQKVGILIQLKMAFNFGKYHLSILSQHIFEKISHMVKIEEDAYWPNNLLLFTFDCEHYCRIHGSFPCWDSTLEQFLFCWVSKKIEKRDVPFFYS